MNRFIGNRSGASRHGADAEAWGGERGRERGGEGRGRERGGEGRGEGNAQVAAPRAGARDRGGRGMKGQVASPSGP